MSSLGREAVVLIDLGDLSFCALSSSLLELICYTENSFLTERLEF